MLLVRTQQLFEAASETRKKKKKFYDIRHQVQVLDFVYYGEISLSTDDLNSFMALAELLQIRGLTGPNDITLFRVVIFKFP
jgi:hypothetical protein